jgi:hypothetical protein
MFAVGRLPLIDGCGIVDFFTAFIIQIKHNYPSIEKEAFSLTESIVSTNEDSTGRSLRKGEEVSLMSLKTTQVF